MRGVQNTFYPECVFLKTRSFQVCTSWEFLRVFSPDLPLTHFIRGGKDEAVAEAEPEGITRLQLCCGTDGRAVGRRSKSVSSGESGKRRKVGKGSGNKLDAVA
jgi:hypothetical protein